MVQRASLWRYQGGQQRAYLKIVCALPNLVAPARGEGRSTLLLLLPATSPFHQCHSHTSTHSTWCAQVGTCQCSSLPPLQQHLDSLLFRPAVHSLLICCRQWSSRLGLIMFSSQVLLKMGADVIGSKSAWIGQLRVQRSVCSEVHGGHKHGRRAVAGDPCWQAPTAAAYSSRLPQPSLHISMARTPETSNVQSTCGALQSFRRSCCG